MMIFSRWSQLRSTFDRVGNHGVVSDDRPATSPEAPRFLPGKNIRAPTSSTVPTRLPSVARTIGLAGVLDYKQAVFAGQFP